MDSKPDSHLNYADANTKDTPRIDWLAITCAALAPMTSPCLVLTVMRRFEYAAALLRHADRAISIVILSAPAVLVLSCALFDLGRIRKSNGRLIGRVGSIFAIGMCLFWLIGYAALLLFISVVGMGPGD